MTEHFSHLKNKLSQNWLNASILDIETTRQRKGISKIVKQVRLDSPVSNQWWYENVYTSGLAWKPSQEFSLWNSSLLKTINPQQVCGKSCFWIIFGSILRLTRLAYKCFSFSSICCYRLLRNQRKYNYLVSWIKHLTNKVKYLFHCACMPTLI